MLNESNKKILIVDDNPDIRSGLHVRLKASQYETFFAEDAITAISEARKVTPDLIILDLGLPAGDGFIVMERLRAITHLSHIPVIVFSARDRAANEMQALRGGAIAYLQKPFNDSALMAIVGAVLKQQEGERSWTLKN